MDTSNFHKPGVLVVLVQTEFPLDLLQVLLRESSSRKWLLFEYNDWTEPNKWFTIQGIQSINSLTLPECRIWSLLNHKLFNSKGMVLFFYFSFQLLVNLVFAKIQRLEFVLGVSNRSNFVKNKTNGSPAGVNFIKLLHLWFTSRGIEFTSANVHVTSGPTCN